MRTLKEQLSADGLSDLEGLDLTPYVQQVLPRQRGHFWGGDWQAGTGGQKVFSINPSTGEALTDFTLGTAQDVDMAVQAARQAFPAWAATPPLIRGRLLRRAADIVREHALELALIDAADCGNPVKAMQMDAELAATQLEYFAGLVLEAKGETLPTGGAALNYTLREPLGVVARIYPFNHPFMFAAGKMAAPLAAGNTLVLKPPQQAPLSTLRLMELLEGVFPPGVLNCVVGDREVGAALASHSDVAAVGLIGSVGAGKAVLRAAGDSMKRSLLELGGKNPLIVYPDADFEAAVDGAVRGMNFTWCGQSCGSTSRLLLHESLHDRFIEALVTLLSRRHRPGIATHMGTTMGALIDRTQYDRSMGYIHQAQIEGAWVAYGGKHPVGLENGFFIEPTVLTGVQPEHCIAREEVFGPVLSVMRWRDEQEMLQIANGLEMGLTASVWTQNLATAHVVASRLQAGYVWINECSIHTPGAPFGGYKQSGTGREECLEEMYEFMQVKNVHVNLRRRA